MSFSNVETPWVARSTVEFHDLFPVGVKLLEFLLDLFEFVLQFFDALTIAVRFREAEFVDDLVPTGLLLKDVGLDILLFTVGKTSLSFGGLGCLVRLGRFRPAFLAVVSGGFASRHCRGWRDLLGRADRKYVV